MDGTTTMVMTLATAWPNTLGQPTRPHRTLRQHCREAITTGVMPSAHKANHPPCDQQTPTRTDMAAPPENMAIW